jgi:hypothetical protein
MGTSAGEARERRGMDAEEWRGRGGVGGSGGCCRGAGGGRLGTTDRWAPPVSGSGRARAAADWAGLGREEREKVLGRLSAQSQKKTF